MADLNFDHMRAYGNGVLDGYNTGNENNPYEQDDLRFCYSEGYQYGVAMYCQDNHPEELK